MTATAGSSFAAATAHPLDRYCDVGAVRLRYRDEGTGPAVLLVHGWTLDLEMWEPQVLALRGAFRLVRLDRRGHGLSGGLPDTGLDAGDLAALCRHLTLSRVALIGMSQGARGVIAFAAAARGQVSAMILDGAPTMEPVESDDVPVREFQELAQHSGMAAFRREWARRPFAQLQTQDVRWHVLLAAMIERYPGHELLGPVVTTPAPRVRLEAIDTPTLILVGQHDLPSRAQAADYLSARLPRAELAVINDAGHLPNLDQPARYSELCRAFLARHADAGA